MVLNGPNLNMLGIREKSVYGQGSYQDLVLKIEQYCKQHQIEVTCLQSNHEGTLIDYLQQAYFENYDGVVFNPGGYTHTSVAIRDAISAISPINVIEVHISQIMERESFRHFSYIKDVCQTSIVGKGFDGYIEAIEQLTRNI